VVNPVRVNFVHRSKNVAMHNSLGYIYVHRARVLPAQFLYEDNFIMSKSPAKVAAVETADTIYPAFEAGKSAFDTSKVADQFRAEGGLRQAEDRRRRGPEDA
jgi:hypothetical protein